MSSEREAAAADGEEGHTFRFAFDGPRMILVADPPLEETERRAWLETERSRAVRLVGYRDAAADRADWEQWDSYRHELDGTGMLIAALEAAGEAGRC